MWILLLAACTHLAAFESARTLAPGQVEAAVEVSALEAWRDGATESQHPVDLALRVGLRDGLDLGVHGLSTQPEVDLRLRLHDGGPDHVAVAWAPWVSAWHAGEHGISNTSVQLASPFLLGVPVQRSELVLGAGPRFDFAGVPAVGAVVQFSPVGQVAFAWQVVPRLHVIPAIALGFPAVRAGTAGWFAGGGVVAQAGVAVQVGPRGEAR